MRLDILNILCTLNVYYFMCPVVSNKFWNIFDFLNEERRELAKVLIRAIWHLILLLGLNWGISHFIKTKRNLSFFHF